MSQSAQRTIFVWADWVGLGGPTFMGSLFATSARGKEIMDDVTSAVRQWPTIARRLGISRDEQERMAPAFEPAG